MKLIILAALLASAINLANCGMMEFLQTHLVLKKELLVEVTKMANECKEESKITDEVFTRLENFEVPDVREFKAFLKCFVLKFGTIKPNGVIDLTPLETTATKKQYDIFAECANIQGADLQERVFDMYKCYIAGLKRDNVVL